MNPFTSWKRLSLSVVLTVLLVPTARLRADERRPDCFVLSVGVDDYPKVGKLKGCVNDAYNIAAAFRRQEGKVFGKVVSTVLVDRAATRAAVGNKMAELRTRGTAGDFVVLFYSGHGGRRPETKAWFFLPWNYDGAAHEATQLSDRQLLATAEGLVEQGKKVLVIIDACYAGQFRRTARERLNRARRPGGGGLILMLSSMPNQTSAALGSYSAFAKAVVDALNGEADLDGDGYVTLREVRRYAYEQTYHLIRQRGLKEEQDGECDWSLSISEDLRLAVAERPMVWTGNESLAKYGKLTFRFYPGGRVTMIDSQRTSEGSWEKKGKQVTLRFYAGRVVYTGTTRGTTLSGTARNERTSWSWTVAAQIEVSAAAGEE